MISSFISSEDFNMFQLEKIKQSFVQITEIESEKNAKELHDDFGQQIILIKYLFEIYSSKKKKDNELENEIKKSISCLYDGLRSLIENKTISTKENYNLIQFISDQKQKIDIIKPNFLHTNTCSKKCEHILKKLKNEICINIIRIVQEFISNSLKHSCATGLSISFFLSNNRPYLLLTDNGKGFNLKNEKNGNGIKNIFWRLQIMESKFGFESNTDGTSLFIEI